MKLYITTDTIGAQSGGGVVTKNEYEALKSLDNNVVSISNNDISPINIGLPETPFLQDYLAMERIAHVDTTKIDMAHIYAGPFTNTIRLLKAKGIKTALTCAAHDRKESIKEFENLGYDYPFDHVKDDKLWNIYNGGIKEADIVIAPSKISAGFLKNEGCKKVEIIHHGCYIPEKVEQIPDQFNVGYLGSLGPDKGLKYLIQTWSELGYKDSTLIFVGKGTESLESFINKYATDGKFHLGGWTENTAQLYNNISVYVQPSVTEGFGIEVLEAMSYGRPVIVSNGAGAADVVSEGIDGFIVSKRDPKTIAEKIDWFKNHPKELREMGNNAKEKAKEYSWDKTREKYINLWKELLLTNSGEQ